MEELPQRTFTLPDGQIVLRNWANFAAGLIPIEELDDEELHREQLKNRHGTFAVRPSKAVPRALRRAIQSEIQRRYGLRYQAALPDAQQVFLDIMNDPTGDPKDRLRASQYVQERMVGKVVDKVEISAEIKPWEGIVSGIINDLDEVDEAGQKDSSTDG